MKILYFSRSYTPHDFRFLSTIVEGGHQTYFLRLDDRKSSETRPLPKGVRPVSGRLKDVIVKLSPDLLHAGPLPDCGYQAARSGFHPLVQMSWGSDVLWDAQKNAAILKRVRLALDRADVVIGDCKAVKLAATKFGVSPNRIVTFPWGVDLSKFRPSGGDGGLRTKLGWQNKFVFLHLRAWHPLYDPLTVVRAFVGAARRNEDLRLLMPGSGSLSSKILRIIQKAGMQERLYFAGQIGQPDLPIYYRAADVYVSASLSDGSSVSLLEALACGLPTLVSDIPGNREWVQSGKQGWLFPIKDEAGLSEKMLKAAKSQRILEMKKLARRTAESKADWGLNKERLFMAYKLAMETKR